MNGKSYPVVVGVVGSFAAIRAGRWAAADAEEFGAPLQILHLKPDRTSSDAIADPTAAEMAARRESAEAIVQAAEQAVRAHFKGLHIACAQVVGSAGQALVESSRVARLIVLGTDELSLGTAVLVGSTTMSVAAHSTCPVVAWRGGAISPPDNPSSSEWTTTTPVGLRSRRPAGDVALPFMIDWGHVERDAPQHLSDMLMPWIDLYPGVYVTEIVDSDRPSRALLRFAQDAQLFVIGSRGRGASDRRRAGFHRTQPAAPLGYPGHDLPLRGRSRLNGRC